ncbi:uncharacterized protein B0I36DRAFT_352922 [Microdochium trichocladiopsis]|uniref:Uncharacterized protein n=1 Tax=Microdochium trichocladiopsis TaxID=1682393 RepID=A0A9P9BLA3_9PEZI|nr:uncharacterized protein B0I36DRAFT_352922 [Microdochium trichocladiopsis]KAH7024717.1 hypothetical protein B0I36DRAFT_352922 [Microdochium trichocladiopsis]
MYPEPGEKLIHEEEDFDFLDVLDGASSQLASDGRDYVYALLSHPSATLSDGELIVEPDYTKTKQHVFKDVALRLIEETKSLRILAVVSPNKDHLSNDGFPTWLPQWDGLRENCPGSFKCRLTSNLSFAAPGYDPPLYWYISAGKTDLHVRGYVVDVIDEVTITIRIPEHSLKRPNDRPFYEIENWPLPAAPAFRSRQNSDLKSRLSEICCTLLANGRRKPLEREYYDFCRFRHHILSCASVFDGKTPRHPIAPEGFGELCASASLAKQLHFIPEIVLANCNNRKLFSTKAGRLGLGSHLVESGDLCCVVHGCSVPLILRRDRHGYRMLGAAYVQGFIIGESGPDDGSEAFQEQEFVLF